MRNAQVVSSSPQPCAGVLDVHAPWAHDWERSHWYFLRPSREEAPHPYLRKQTGRHRVRRTRPSTRLGTQAGGEVPSPRLPHQRAPEAHRALGARACTAGPTWRASPGLDAPRECVVRCAACCGGSDCAPLLSGGDISFARGVMGEGKHEGPKAPLQPWAPRLPWAWVEQTRRDRPGPLGHAVHLGGRTGPACRRRRRDQCQRAVRRPGGVHEAPLPAAAGSRDVGAYLTGQWPHGADITATALGPEVVEHAHYDAAPFVLGLAVPDCAYAAGRQNGEIVAWFYSLRDRSAARHTSRPSGTETHRAGPRGADRPFRRGGGGGWC